MNTLDIPAIAASAVPVTLEQVTTPNLLPSDSTGLSIDQSAIDRLQHLQQLRQSPDLKLRIRIRGGGCSGFQYKFELITDDPTDEDVTFGADNASFVVDRLSLQLLQGAVLRYQVSTMESGFQLDNPQAKSACGCGISFDLA